MIAERTGGDGLSALIAAASSGRIEGEGSRRKFVTGQPLREYNEFWPVPAAWWAAINDPTTVKRGFRVYPAPATNSLINQRVLGFHPGTEYPASQVQWIVRSIRFSQERADELWPSSSGGNQAPPSAQSEPEKNEDNNRDKAIVATLRHHGNPPADIRWAKFWAEVLRASGRDPKKPPWGYGTKTIERRTKAILQQRNATKQDI